MGLALETSIQVAILFIYMIVGMVLKKTNKLTKQGVTDATNILLNVVTPCVLIHSYQQKDFNAELFKEWGFAFLLSVIIHIVIIIISTVIFRRRNNDNYGINVFTSVYSNCGFMAIPLLTATLGDNGVFFGSTYLVVFTVLSWTHGVFVISGDRKEISVKKLFLNPGVIGVSIALLLFFLKIKLPGILATPVSAIASMNTPLAIILLGTFLLGIKPTEIFKNLDVTIVTALRLIIAPAITILIAYFLPFSPDVKLSVIIPAACPGATISALFALRYNKNANHATQIVSIATLISIITLPLIILLAQFVGI